MTREEIDALWDRVAHRYGVDQREPDWAVLRALPVDAVATGIEGRMQISLGRGIVATGGYVRQAALEAVAPPQELEPLNDTVRRAIADLETLRRVIGNCYISAKRGLSAGRKGVVTLSPEAMIEKRDEQLRNIVRFCESVGERSDVLRWQLPTEITDGSGGLPAEPGTEWEG